MSRLDEEVGGREDGEEEHGGEQLAAQRAPLPPPLPPRLVQQRARLRRTLAHLWAGGLGSHADPDMKTLLCFDDAKRMGMTLKTLL